MIFLGLLRNPVVMLFPPWGLIAFQLCCAGRGSQAAELSRQMTQATEEVSRVTGDGCEAVLKRGLFSVSLSATNGNVSTEHKRMLCAADFQSHGDALAFGLAIGASVYGERLRVGGSFDSATKASWMERNCEDAQGEDHYASDFRWATQQVNGKVLASWLSCVQQNRIATDQACGAVLRYGVLNRTLMDANQSSAHSLRTFLCGVNTNSHDELIAAGFSLGFSLYDVPLEVGGTFNEHVVETWKSQNCSAQTSARDSAEGMRQLRAWVDPALLGAWERCTRFGRGGLVCGVSSEGSKVFVDAVYVPAVGESGSITISGAQTSSGISCPQPDSEVDAVGQYWECSRTDFGEGRIKLHGAEQSCLVTVAEACGKHGEPCCDGQCSGSQLSCQSGICERCNQRTETCNGQDDDCDGQIDEDTGTEWYRDKDEDGFGNPAERILSCHAPDGYVKIARDCYDENAAARPNQTAFFETHCGDGSFDYNCDLHAQRRWATRGYCGGFGSSCDADKSVGWFRTVPGCGATAQWLDDCDYRFPATCRRERSRRTQQCR